MTAKFAEIPLVDQKEKAAMEQEKKKMMAQGIARDRNYVPTLKAEKIAATRAAMKATNVREHFDIQVEKNSQFDYSYKVMFEDSIINEGRASSKVTAERLAEEYALSLLAEIALEEESKEQVLNYIKTIG